MNLYYLTAEYSAGKHRIVAAVYEKDVFSFDESILSGHAIYQIDEIAPDNRALCLDLTQSVNKIDINGEGKYYVLNGPELHDVDGWVEYRPELPV